MKPDLRPGQDMVAARAARYRKCRTERLIKLMETSPPLTAAQRYAIAQALAELPQLDTEAPPGARLTGGARSLAEDADDDTRRHAVQDAWEAYEVARARAGMLPATYDPVRLAP